MSTEDKKLYDEELEKTNPWLYKTMIDLEKYWEALEKLDIDKK